jgi:chitinase
MSPALVAQCWNAFQKKLEGLMTWSIDWDGSLQGR